ncbi:hypothetical protein GCM10023340_07210 [Nocardioides marinquilinus]|uniref:DUF6286 domain-containing protein n=1 Tax=Nocardioides marinquilinus TaxID=1210400 RepID=A0ABP9P9L3_9ACTN
MSAAERTARRRPPRRAYRGVVVAVLVALALVGLAVVGVHDLLVDRGLTDGSSWSRDVLDAVDGTTPSTAIVVAAVVVAVLGVVLLLVGLAPSRRTHVPVTGDDGRGDVWISPRALATLATSVADHVPGVVGAEVVRAGRRQVVVQAVTHTTATTDAPTDRAADDVTSDVQAAVTAGVGALTPTTVAVRTTELES